MKLGFVTNYSDKFIAFAKEVGFTSVQLLASPGSVLDADRTTDEDVTRIQEILEQNGITVSALGFYANHLDPDPGKKKRINDYFINVIHLCNRMGVGIIATFGGRDPEKSISDNIPLFKDVFSSYVIEAESKGLKIAIENCVTMCGFPFRGSNIAYCPQAWDLMFDAVESAALGLELDPSHLYWLGIDYTKAVYDYKEKIYHVHAKDTEIFEDQLFKIGIYGKGWWRFRIPGLGNIDWNSFFTALYDIGYNGGVDIEHEDSLFRGEKFEKGLILGFEFLSQFIF